MVHPTDENKFCLLTEPMEEFGNRFVLIYDMEANSWTDQQINTGPHRFGGMGSVAPNNDLLLFGGMDIWNGVIAYDIQRWLADIHIFSPGEIDSSVYQNSSDSWTPNEIILQGNQPSGTDVTPYVRTGDSSNPDTQPGQWTTWKEADGSLPPELAGKEFAQYRLDFESTSESEVPIVDDIDLELVQSPGDIASVPIKPPKPSGWKKATFEADTPSSSSVKIQVADEAGVLLPDSVLPNNSAGFTSSPVDLNSVNPNTYRSLRLVGTLEAAGSGKPQLNSWGIEWGFELPVNLNVDINNDGNFEDAGKQVKAEDVLNYRVQFTNDANNDFTDVKVKSSVPDGTTYVPDSTYVNGQKIPDNSCPLEKGVNIGNVISDTWEKTSWTNGDNVEMHDDKLRLKEVADVTDFLDTDWSDRIPANSNDVRMNAGSLELDEYQVVADPKAYLRAGIQDSISPDYMNMLSSTSIGNNLWVNFGVNTGTMEAKTSNWKYDSTTDIWTKDTDPSGPAPMPEGRVFGTAAENNGKILGFGGLDMVGMNIYKDTFIYNPDPVVDAWSWGADSPLGVVGGSATTVGNTTYVFCGASDVVDNVPVCEGAVMSCDQNGQNWDTDTNHGGSLAPMLITDSWMYKSAYADGKIYVIGLDGGMNPIDMQIYDIADKSWSTIAVPEVYNLTLDMTEYNNDIYIVSNFPDNHIGVYDTDTGTWSTVFVEDEFSNPVNSIGTLNNINGVLYMSKMTANGWHYPIDGFYAYYGTTTTKYYEDGWVTSNIHDRGSKPTSYMYWNDNVPVDTTFTVEARAGNTPTPDGSWEAWDTIINSGDQLPANINEKQYFQYRLSLHTDQPADPSRVTPSVLDASVGQGEPYFETPGWVESEVFDAGKKTWFGGFTVDRNTPPDTNIVIKVRTGDTPNLTGGWTEVDGNGKSLPESLQNKRYIQYRVEMSSANAIGPGRVSPELEKTTLDYPTTNIVTFKVKVGGNNGAGPFAKTEEYKSPSIISNQARITSNELNVNTNTVGNPLKSGPPPPPVLPSTWYLAEGYTCNNVQYDGEFFDTYIAIQNPNEDVADVTAEFMVPDPSQNVVQTYQIQPYSRYTIFVDDIAGLEATDVSTKVTCTNSLGIAVERAMYFDYYGKVGGHSAIGIPEPKKNWYLAEGNTVNDPDSSFDTYVLMQNPNKKDATAHLTFMAEDGHTGELDVNLPAASRQTVKVDDVPNFEKAYVSTEVNSTEPIVVERSMYFDYYGKDGGTDSQGAAEPDTQWYLAEGCTRQGPNSFDTYILLMNPTDETAEILGTYMKPYTDERLQRNYTVPPHSRYTIRVDDVPLPGFDNLDVASYFESLNGTTFLADRAMYFNYQISNGEWVQDGTASIGTSASANTWFVPEGLTSPTFDTWILVQNPNSEPMDITMFFMPENGQMVTKTYTLTPNCRFTLKVNDVMAEAGAGTGTIAVSTEVASRTKDSKGNFLPIIVEGSTYFNYAGIKGGTNSIGIGVNQ